MKIYSILLILCALFRLDFVYSQDDYETEIIDADDYMNDMDPLAEEMEEIDEYDLQEILENFALLPTSEKKAAIAELFEDDPDTLKALMEQLDAQEQEEEVFVETVESLGSVLDFLQDSSEGAWERILENKEKLFDDIAKSGIMSDEDSDLFKNDSTAWEDELKRLWVIFSEEHEEDGNDDAFDQEVDSEHDGQDEHDEL